jgi:TetR/AcrR family transcriptional repressor of nem operon
MISKEDTKEKILSVGAGIIHRKGFHYTGIQEILKAAGVPKGSFYFYFKNKEDFGLQVIDWYMCNFQQIQAAIEERTGRGSGLRRLSATMDGFADYYRELDFTCGCPVGNLAQEMGDLSETFNRKLQQAVDRIVAFFARLIREAREQGEIAADLDVEETARFIVASWHGALIHMKISKGPAPLINHKKFVFESVLGVSGWV